MLVRLGAETLMEGSQASEKPGRELARFISLAPVAKADYTLERTAS